MIKICESCGKEFEAKEDFHKRCLDCHRSRPPSRKGRTPPPQAVPAECTFTTFYGEDGQPKREIFIESAEKMARILEAEGMKISQIRTLYNMLKTALSGLRTYPEASFGEARTTFYKFVRHVGYQHRRGLVPDVFLKFVKDHVDVATKDENEFAGFVEYLHSILAGINPK
jgi:CRISPR/Cas system CSM-associated protein Csm2 small subunit